MFYSQYGQDILISGLFKGKRDGVFVDIGAYDGIIMSNTYYLERELGWQGVCVEANKEIYDRLKENRICFVDNIAVYDKIGEIEFSDCKDNDFMSGIEEDFLLHNQNKFKLEKSKIRCVDLDTVLTKYKLHDIDYLSLDVEGSEYKILSNFPFDKYNIKVISVEINKSHSNVLRLLLENGYRYLCTLGQDDFYTKIPLTDISESFVSCRTGIEIKEGVIGFRFYNENVG